MPELPEVETTRRGILPHVLHRRVERVVIRNGSLRWPISRGLSRDLSGQRIEAVDRRAKYLLLRAATGTAILHLGMSGSLRVLPGSTPPLRHDHVDLVLEGGQCLRLRDPRRFGALLWTRRDPGEHRLLAHLGPEPFAEELDEDHLYHRSRGRRAPLRNFLLDGRIVAGVGNIYANEAAFLAGIRPDSPAGRVSRSRYRELVRHLRDVLHAAIDLGGTTLRDFTRSDGEPGSFRTKLRVYDREGDECPRCGETVRRRVLGGRSLFFCRGCQR